MEGGMIEAGAVFAALLAALRVIEKLVDKKMGNGARPVQVDLHQTEIASKMGEMTECLAATGQTLERINDKIDDVHTKVTKVETLSDNMNRVTTETGANVFKLLEDVRLKEAEERGRAQAMAVRGEQ
jgi:methyl-accepting chemotaxis protein